MRKKVNTTCLRPAIAAIIAIAGSRMWQAIKDPESML